MKVVREVEVEAARAAMNSVGSLHVYSIQKSALPDIGLLYGVDYDVTKQHLSSTSRLVCLCVYLGMYLYIYFYLILLFYPIFQRFYLVALWNMSLICSMTSMQANLDIFPTAFDSGCKQSTRSFCVI